MDESVSDDHIREAYAMELGRAFTRSVNSLIDTAKAAFMADGLDGNVAQALAEAMVSTVLNDQARANWRGPEHG